MEEDNTQTYNNGDTIPEDNIELYFVWIPKYSYQIFNLGETDGYTEGKPETSNAQEIQIKFGTTNTSDNNENECTTPMTSGASGNCKVGDYMASPAFISMNTNGLCLRSETYGSSGFDVIKLKTYNNKYYEEYDKNSDKYTYSKRILGDATGEMGLFYGYPDTDNNYRTHNSWYTDYYYFVGSSESWFGRCGCYYDGVLVSQFIFSRYAGGANSGLGFRLVLTK